jgi:subtilisin family serine protease
MRKKSFSNCRNCFFVGAVGLLFVLIICLLNTSPVETPGNSASPRQIAGHARSVRYSKKLQQAAKEQREKQPSRLVHSSSPKSSGTVQYRALTPDEMGLTEEETRFTLGGAVSQQVPGRRIPEMVTLKELESGAWKGKAVALPEANTLDNWYYQQRLFGVLDEGTSRQKIFVPQAILLKLQDQEVLAAIRVPERQELTAIRILQGQANVEYAGLNILERRMSAPDDPGINLQWHHDVIGSREAWNITTGNGSVRVAILDSPFQMDHPDLAANVIPGWDVMQNVPVTNSAGIDHSTGAAGLVAAVINNELGVAGADNCKILPISIHGTLAEMYLGTLWAASNGVRVVNISWTGAQDPIMSYSGQWLEDHTRGILAMIGGNDPDRLDYTNYPAVVAIAATDANDNAPYSYGPHIDFAAPGVAVYSTVTSSGYGTQSGTSFATPLFCGVVATLMTINPALGPDDVLNLLKNTAVDLGTPGWDEHYGWGRIDFAKAAQAAADSLRIVSTGPTPEGFTVSMTYWPGVNYSLWSTPQLSPPMWQPIPDTILETNDGVISLTDPQPLLDQNFYRVSIQSP